MSQKLQGGGRQHGLPRPSSTSSTSSSSSTSRNRHRRNRHPRMKRTKSRSRSRSQSSDSTPSDSNTPPRSRSEEHHHHNSGSNRSDDEANVGNGKKIQQKLFQTFADTDMASDASPDRQHVDDSIRSDKSSEMATNGGLGESADAMSQRLDAFKGQRVCTTSTSKMTKPASSKGLSASARLKGIQFGKPGTVVRPGIQMKLAQPKAPPEKAKKITVASAFNNDSDDEAEEMPPECKMRMRNIGRDTPTSSGPNSFGKTKQGFIDSKKLFEKSLREAASE